MKQSTGYLLLILLLIILSACTPTAQPQTTTRSPPVLTATLGATEPATTVPPTSTATAVFTPTPTIIEPTATLTTVPTETAVSLEQLPLPTPTTPITDKITFGVEGHIAFVQNQSLYIQDLNQATSPVFIDSCAEVETGFCRNLYPKWSPDGRFLLYLHIQSNLEEIAEIRLATPQGDWQKIGSDAHDAHPATWSPDGNEIVYLRDTGEENSQFRPIMEVVTIPVDDGKLGKEQINGTLTLDQPGCGGGYASPSSVLYGNEGGTALGYLMGILEWTAQDILLFTSNCTNVGMDRYDLSSGTKLEHFEKPIRNLTLLPNSDRWYGMAVTYSEAGEKRTELVTGTVTETAVSSVETTFPVEMIFVGQQSGALYMTSRTQLEEINERWLYQFNETTLYRVDVETGLETAVYHGEDFALAHVQEAADGTTLFVQIENARAHYEAVQAGVENDLLSHYTPKRHIVALDKQGNLLYVRPDAGTPMVTP